MNAKPRDWYLDPDNCEWRSILDTGLDKEVIRVMKEYHRDRIRENLFGKNVIYVYFYQEAGELFFETFVNGEFGTIPFDPELYEEAEHMLEDDRDERIVLSCIMSDR